jgi:hypothetical protein
LKHYIYNPRTQKWSYLGTFEDMLDWFARHNNGRYRGSGLWDMQRMEINPRIHHPKDYNYALNQIAMNVNDLELSGFHYGQNGHDEPKYEKRSIMVVDEFNRIIDPRLYWDTIATRKVVHKPKRKTHPFRFRFDPVPKTGKRSQGKSLRHPKTMNERRMAADPEMKDFIKPSRDAWQLPHTWDDIFRPRKHCWKDKKLTHQYLRNIKP